MKSILLMSILLMTLALPALAARKPDGVRGLRWMTIRFAAFVVAYYLWVAYGHTALFVPHR
jgi:uncharacterized membrane protein